MPREYAYARVSSQFQHLDRPANTLLFKHYCYQDSILEGNTDVAKIQSGFEHWSQWCVITEITPKYIRIELPNKSKLSERPISYYADYELSQGYWVVCADYATDIDQFYWCRNKLQASLRSLSGYLMREKCCSITQCVCIR